MKQHQKANKHELLQRLHLQFGFSVWLRRFVYQYVTTTRMDSCNDMLVLLMHSRQNRH